MNKIIVIDTSGLFVPTVKVYNRQLQTITLQKKPLIVKELGEETTKNWTDFDFYCELKKRKKFPFVMLPHVMYFNSIISCLKKIGVNPDDIIVMALEGHSWRKDFYAPYKDHREAQRDADKFIDWKFEFQRCNKLHKQLEESTDWYFLREWSCAEADDICAMIPKIYKDKEIIIITGDKDLHQLAYYKNVKILNTNKKLNGSKGMYEVTIKNPLKIIADKVKNGDISDKILVDKINDTEEDCELRYTIINLLELPDFVENKIKAVIDEKMKERKKLNLEKLPPFKNIKEKFLKIYKKEKIISYQYCVNLQNKRDIKKKEKQRQKYQKKIKKGESK